MQTRLAESQFLVNGITETATPTSILSPVAIPIGGKASSRGVHDPF
jgi:hypothetical protein